MKYIKYCIFVICFFILFIVAPNKCYANPDTTPFIVIIVDNAPSDLEISFGNKEYDHIKKDKFFKETQFSFYDGSITREQGYKMSATTNGKTTEYSINPPLEYKNIFILNLQNNTLTNGKTPLRYIKLVLTYILLTLFLEGFIFYIFGFRKKKSWTFFIIINIITQVFLHFWTDSPNHFYRFYFEGAMLFDITIYELLILGLITGEFLVFLFEIMAFTIFVREKKFLKRICYALVANLFSLILGFFVLTYIPFF